MSKYNFEIKEGALTSKAFIFMDRNGELHDHSAWFARFKLVESDGTNILELDETRQIFPVVGNDAAPVASFSNLTNKGFFLLQILATATTAWTWTKAKWQVELVPCEFNEFDWKTEATNIEVDVLSQVGGQPDRGTLTLAGGTNVWADLTGDKPAVADLIMISDAELLSPVNPNISLPFVSTDGNYKIKTLSGAVMTFEEPIAGIDNTTAMGGDTTMRIIQKTLFETGAIRIMEGTVRLTAEVIT